MKLAKLDDYKRALSHGSSSWPFKLQRFAVSSIPSLGTAEFAINSPFLILSGPNGVGKTTMLRALWSAALPNQLQGQNVVRWKLTGGGAELDYSWNGEGGQSTVSFSGGSITGGSPVPVEVVHLDPGYESQRMLKFFCDFENGDDIINGAGEAVLNNEQISTFNHVSGRDYQSVTVYEVEMDDAPVPFFQVRLGTSVYDSRSMGAGEAAALYAWWAVERANPNSILLVEEPETFLSPASQRNLTSFLIAATATKKLTTIITSHSPAVIQSLPESNCIFSFRESGGAIRFSRSPSLALLKTIGIEFKKDRVCLVEDEGASILLDIILRRYRPDLLRRIAVIVKNGEGNITRTLESFKDDTIKLKVIGVYDGDQRSKLKAGLESLATFLPGDKAFEIILRDMILTNPDEAERAIGHPQFHEIMFGLGGMEAHDWYSALCDQTNMSKSQIFNTLYSLWERVGNNETDAQAVTAEISVLFDGLEG